MADTLFPQAREVVLSELLTNGKRATCWVDRGAFRDLSMESWWEAVSAAGEGWRQNDIRVFGQWHKEPRLTAWWGPAYQYANVTWPQRPMSEEVQTLKARVEALAAFAYNGVLVNGYRDGQDSMGWHRDNEPEIDQASIASLSLGTSRTFKVRDRRTKAVVNIDLHHGDLLVMEHLQEVHEH
ncbi:MAG: alpha-ketoglutarate-dependent dioxygenase AlkB family protein, partial [Flavobacteriales bacterium]